MSGQSSHGCATCQTASRFAITSSHSAGAGEQRTLLGMLASNLCAHVWEVADEVRRACDQLQHHPIGEGSLAEASETVCFHTFSSASVESGHQPLPPSS